MAEDLFGLVGSTIDGRYRLERVVGQGGFGVVYGGMHVHLNEPVAVKCLNHGGVRLAG